MKNPTTLARPLKEKTGPHGCMLAHLIGCQEYLSLLVFLYHFWSRLMVGAKLWGR